MCVCVYKEGCWHFGAIVHNLVCKCCSNHWAVWSHRFLSLKLAIYRCLNVILRYIGGKSLHRRQGLHLPVISRLSGPPNTPLLNTRYPLTVGWTITIRHFTHHQCWLTKVSNCVGYLWSYAQVCPSPTHHMMKTTFCLLFGQLCISCTGIFHPPTEAFNLCILRSFVLLFCWMNQSVTELNKKHTQNATWLKSGLIWVVVHYHSGGMRAVDFRGTTTGMSYACWKHQWQTVTVQPQSFFTVSSTTRQCCGLEEVNLCRDRGWGLTLLCNLWVKEMWDLPTLVSVRWIATSELCQSNFTINKKKKKKAGMKKKYT